MLSSRTLSRGGVLARSVAHAGRPMLAVPTRRAYHETIIDHYESPRNVGSMDKKDVDVGTGLVGAPACGDVMKLQIRVGEDGRVQDAVFKVRVKPRCGRFIAAPPSLPFFRFAAGRSRFRVRVSSFPLRGPRPRRHAS